MEIKIVRPAGLICLGKEVSQFFDLHTGEIRKTKMGTTIAAAYHPAFIYRDRKKMKDYKEQIYNIINWIDKS